MFSPQNIHFKKILRLSFIFLVFEIVLLVLLIVITALTFHFKKLNEIIAKDIDITGINSFTFTKNSEEIQYTPGIPNLGNTSLVSIDCYAGWCKKKNNNKNYYIYNNNNLFMPHFNYFSSKINNITINNNSLKLKKKIRYLYEDDDDDYKEYSKYLNFNCSKECAIKNQKSCNSCPKEYVSSEGECNFRNRDYNYNSEKYCFANNLILKWKGLLYSSKNATTYKKYSYINSAILPNESCPYNTKLCGFLDDYGNKLCILNSEDCPINKIVISDIRPYDGYHYNFINFNNISIYYTNEAKETGKIVKGFFVDSDFLIQYKNGCEIIDEGTIDEIINDNRNVYSNYKKKAYKEKSYLKICNFGHDIKINLNEMRKNYKENLRNKDLNENITDKIRSSYGLVGGLGFFDLIFLGLFLILIVGPPLTKQPLKEPISARLFFGVLFFFVIFGVIIIFATISYNKSLKDLENKIKDNEDIFSWNTCLSLIIVNTAFYIIFIIYIGAIFIGFSIYFIISYGKSSEKDFQKSDDYELLTKK